MHVPRSAATPGPRRGLFVARRRWRVWPALLLGTVALLLLWLVLVGLPPGAYDHGGPAWASPGDDADAAAGSSDAPDAAGAPADEADDSPSEVGEPGTPALASVAGVGLHLTTSDPVVVGFHEASAKEALELHPAGVMVENENTTKFSPPAEVDDGSDYLVLSSRGRVHAATSAVDVLMRVDDPVRSPVHGTVTDVRTYHLYDTHEDHRIEVAPTERPDLRVVLIHVDDVHVEVGDVVVAGETMLAGTARPFPFGSQIDRYTEPDRFPHVHLEVKHEDAEVEATSPEADDDGD